MNKQKICHKFFPVKKTTKNNIIIMLLHTYLLQIVQKNWMKKEEKEFVLIFS